MTMKQLSITNQMTKKIIKQLSKVIDPELDIDIVNLGLIYGIKQSKEDQWTINFTLTYPGCPLAPYFHEQINSQVSSIEGIQEVVTKLVFKPSWTRQMISPGFKNSW